ncbi:MAG: sigma-70 family RNA polymerase sigma factor [Ruminococcaceae bacterium]|nr:sigma-70 family RNA polymerase sigma factor [Oscillospiraceae bacterium]
MDNIKELLLRSSHGDTDARNQLVSENLNLIRSIVKRFMGRGYDYEELFQVGCIGLIKAADRFELGFNVRFSTYAVPLIMGEIQRFIRDDNPLHISRSLKELSIKCLKEKERIENTYNREARVSEIAELCNVSVYEVSEALNVSYPPESIYREICGDDGKSVTIADRISDDRAEGFISDIILYDALDKLSLRDRNIIKLRFMEGKTQAEISEYLGISQVQVSRRLKRILLTLRKECE